MDASCTIFFHCLPPQKWNFAWYHKPLLSACGFENCICEKIFLHMLFDSYCKRLKCVRTYYQHCFLDEKQIQRNAMSACREVGAGDCSNAWGPHFQTAGFPSKLGQSKGKDYSFTVHFHREFLTWPLCPPQVVASFKNTRRLREPQLWGGWHLLPLHVRRVHLI